MEWKEEVGDREIVGHPVFRRVGDDDLNVRAPVLVPVLSQQLSRLISQDRGDLDADHPAKAAFRGLMDHSPLSAP